MKSQKLRVYSKFSIYLLSLFLLILFYGNCSRPTDSEHSFSNNNGSEIGAPVDTNTLSYANIAPIIAKRCVVCHQDFTDPNRIQLIATNGVLNQLVVEAQTMPPTGPLPQEERDLIARWISIGAPMTSNSGEPPPPVVALTPLEKCMACHGQKGVSSKKGTPHLAGQKKEYLLQELKRYATDVRIDNSGGGMNSIAKSLTEADLTEVVTYFSSLSGSEADPGRRPNEAELLLMTKSIRETGYFNCYWCHFGMPRYGPNRGSSNIIYPNLVFQDEEYSFNQLKAYSTGKRYSNMMAFVGAWKFTDDQLRGLALYFRFNGAY